MYVMRAELFDLVWSHPRTTLAVRLKVSDVAIAKKCRAANIPMPPAGYWAQLAAGKRVSRPALPLRVPGEPDLIAIGEPRSQRYASPAARSDETPKPPSFADDVEALVDAAMKALSPVKAQRDLSDPHSGLARLLRQEEERRKKFAETSWSYYEPQFDDAVSQRQLRIYSALFRAFAKLGVRGNVSDEQQWKPGVGSSHRLSGSVDFGGAWVRLSIARVQEKPATTSLTLRVGSDDEATAHAVWQDEPQRPLEKQLDAIARSILECAEQRLRAHAQQIYEWQLRQQEDHAREAVNARRAEEARQAALLARQEQLRRRALYTAAARHKRAVDVRSLVSAIQNTHPELALNARFGAWCAFALGEADRLDPVHGDWSELLEITPAPDARSPASAE